MRLVSIFAVAAAALAGATVAFTAPPPTPPCPQVEAWTSAGTFGPIDNGNAVQFRCLYSLPGQPQQLTLDLHWYKPTARDVDMDYSECGRTTSGGSYYTDIWSKSHFVHEEYIVNAGTAAGNAAVFRAEQEHIQKAALVVLTATEPLAKSCTRSASASPTHRDTARPTVRVLAASGRTGTTIALRFTVGDDSGRVTVLLTIYKGPNNRTVLMRKNYGAVAARSRGHAYTARVRAHTRGNNLWCVTARDAAGNKATACSKLVVT